MEYSIMVLINTCAVALAVVIHNFGLLRVAKVLPRVPWDNAKLVIGVLGSLVVHAIEIWMFAGVVYFFHHHDSFGQLEGNFTGTLLDCVYFSFSTYSSLGYGDITPIGSIRYITGIQALTGLVLITWTASFLFIEMRRYWDLDEIED